MEKGCSINCIKKITQSLIYHLPINHHFFLLLCIFPSSSNQSIKNPQFFFFFFALFYPPHHLSIHPILNSHLCVFPSYSFFFLFRSYNYYTLLYNSNNILYYIYIYIFYLIIIIVQRKKKFLLSDYWISTDFGKDRLLYCYYLRHLPGHDDGVVVDVEVLLVVEVILIESLRDSIYK